MWSQKCKFEIAQNASWLHLKFKRIIILECLGRVSKKHENLIVNKNKIKRTLK